MNALYATGTTRAFAPVLLAGCLLLLPACDAIGTAEEARSPVGQWVYREGFDSFTLTLTGAGSLRGTATLTSISFCGLITSYWHAAGAFNDPGVTLRFRLVDVVENGGPVPDPDTTLAMRFSGRMKDHDTMTGVLSGTGAGAEHVTFERTQ